MISGFDEMAAALRRRGGTRLAVVAAHDPAALEAALRAAAENVAEPMLIGDREAILQTAYDNGFTVSRADIIHEPDPVKAVARAMDLAHDGAVSALMKGKIPTPILMRTALRHGLRREGRLLSHFTLLETARLGRLVATTDCAVIPYPTLEQRVEIIRNAVECMRALGCEEPRIACISATEEVSEKVPCSLDYTRLVEMNTPSNPLHGYGLIEGPMDNLSALDAAVAGQKEIRGEVAGRADVLHVPDMVSGNLMTKAVMYFSDSCRSGGCVVGGTVPVVLLSRASPADDKYCSILLALTCLAR